MSENKNKILVALDGSEGSKRAVEFVAKMLGNSHCRIILGSVFRGFNVYEEKEKKISENFFTEAFEEVEIAIEDVRKILENAGIQRKNLAVKIIKGAESRAGALVEAAREENCDTLVFGRKGTSEVGDFDIGRVPWKVIHGAREMTVWLVP